MIENTQFDDQQVRKKLNRIADQQYSDDLLEHSSWEDITPLCDILYEQLEEVITTHVTETALTQREAEVWVLSNFVDAGYTSLSDEAIALVLAAPESPFGANHSTDSDTDSHDNPTAATVKQCYQRAEDKYSEAKQFVGVTTFRDRNQHLETPKLVWVDRSTERRLKSRSRATDTTLDETVNWILDETEICRSLDEVVRLYLEARGKDNVAQIAMNRCSPESGMLMLVAHTATQDAVPDEIKEIDAIVVSGQQYDFDFVEDPDGPHEGVGRTTLYASDTPGEVDAVSVEDGIETARERLQKSSE